MKEFAESVDGFLTFNRYDILPDKGKISRQKANEKANREYEIFNRTQPINSDFDKQIKKMLKK